MAKSPEAIKKEKQIRLLKINEQLEMEYEKRKRIEEDNALEFIVMYPYQTKVMDAFREGVNIVIMPLNNKSGKTTVGACLLHSWVLGYEPWNIVPETYEGAIRAKVKGEMQWCMPSSLGKRPPVKLRITGEDWEKHLGITVIPELKKWAPEGYTTKKNNMGIEAYWQHKNGSEFDVMTYSQEPKLYEAWKGDGWWPDEPPPKAVWSAMSRGLFMTGGKVFMSMTPLKEPWIFDELILSNRPDVRTVTGVTLWETPHLYNHDLSILMKCGLTKEEAAEFFIIQKQEARITKDLRESEKWLQDRVGGKKVEFISEFGQNLTQESYLYAIQNLHIHRFISDLEDDTERLPRAFGEQKHLMGRVLKSFDDKNIVDDFKVPPDWPVMFEIDFHITTPHAVSFITCDPYDRFFICSEIWENMGSEELADAVIRMKQSNVWRMNYGEIDALSKGDTAYVRNRFGKVEDSFTIIERKLHKYGINLGVGSKDEKSYIVAMETRLKGANGMPSLFVFRSCKETIRQMQRWNWDDMDEGHFPECVGRATQSRLKYTDPANWNRPLQTVRLAGLGATA